ncbi:MAG TPA: tetratricopeptide repeat protein, partial [Anaeromyxobacteraceae bacterium]|nr:tetratricopeptide repeat protein [Anaeromyxobacteraceae bacterium]
VPARPVSALVSDGEGALRSGDFRRAEALFAEASAREPGAVRPAVLHARAVFQQGRFEDARALVTSALARGDDAEARVLDGRLHVIARRLEEAARAFERATALAPGDAAAWSALAAVRLALGDDLGAEDAYAASARLAPADAEDRLWTDVLRAPPDPAQVQEALDRCARGTAAYMAGKLGEAAHELRAVIGTVPAFAHCRSELGKILARTGDARAAEHSFRDAIASYRAGQGALRADTEGLLAALLASQDGRAAEAVPLARSAIAVRGERPALLDALAQACDRAGDRACAREAYATLLAAPGPLPAQRREIASARLEALGR